MSKSKAIGIDLGTTYSCVAVWQHDRVEIIVNDQGNRTTPSIVAFTPSERFVGDAAKYQIANNPHNTIFDAKRLIRRRFTDSSVQSDVPSLQVVFEVDADGILQVSARDRGSGVSNFITISNDGGRLSKEEIERMMADAERFRREDEEVKKKSIAKANLENYVYNMRSRVKEAQIQGKTNARAAEDIVQMLNG